MDDYTRMEDEMSQLKLITTTYKLEIDELSQALVPIQVEVMNKKKPTLE